MGLLQHISDRIQHMINAQVKHRQEQLELQALGGMAGVKRRLFGNQDELLIRMRLLSDRLYFRANAEESRYRALTEALTEIDERVVELHTMLAKEDERLNQLIGDAAVERIERKIDWIHQRLARDPIHHAPIQPVDPAWSVTLGGTPTPEENPGAE